MMLSISGTLLFISERFYQGRVVNKINRHFSPFLTLEDIRLHKTIVIILYSGFITYTDVLYMKGAQNMGKGMKLSWNSHYILLELS